MDLLQSAARDIYVFMASSTDHITGITGLGSALTVTMGKNGGALSSISPTVTERSNGWYTLSLTASHTDTQGELGFHVTGSGCDPSDFKHVVVAYNAFDGAYLGLTGIDDLETRLTAARAGYLDELAAANLPTDVANVPSLVWSAVGALGKTYEVMFAEIDAATIVRLGQFQAGSTTQAVVLDSGASALDDFYNRTTLTVVTGSSAGQNRLINDYVGSTRTAYLDRPLLVGAPAASDYFAIDTRGNTRSASDVKIGVAAGAAASSITLQADASALDEYYINMILLIESGTGTEQARRITAYNGTTKVATVDRPWVTTPDTTSRYVILPFARVKVGEIDDDAVSADSISSAAVTKIQAGLALEATLTTISGLVDDLETRLTAARAGYLDELGAANIPADIDTLLGRLTSLRAGYLDELGAANLPADVDTLLTRLSALRAGYIDNLSGGAVALASELSKVLGASAGKKVISADGLQVEVYDESDVLLVTLDRTGAGPYTWTPTWE